MELKTKNRRICLHKKVEYSRPLFRAPSHIDWTNFCASRQPRGCNSDTLTSLCKRKRKESNGSSGQWQSDRRASTLYKLYQQRTADVVRSIRGVAARNVRLRHVALARSILRARARDSFSRHALLPFLHRGILPANLDLSLSPTTDRYSNRATKSR